MLKIFKNYFYVFIRDKYIASILCIGFSLMNLYLIYLLRFDLLVQHPLTYLRLTQRISIFIFILFSFLSYEFVYKAKLQNFDETLKSTGKGYGKAYLSQILLLIIMSFVFFVFATMYNVIVYHIAESNYLPYIKHIVLNNILNILLVSVIGIIFGSVIALKFKRLLSYGVMSLVVFFMSPLSEGIFYSTWILHEVDLYFIKDMIAITPPNTTWISDWLYGLSIEAYRWHLAYAWMCIFMLLLFYHLLKSNNIKKMISVILLILCTFNVVGYMDKGSIMIKDSRPYGTLYSDTNYYESIKQKNTYQDFKITSYKLMLNVDKDLEAQATLVLEAPQALNKYYFTLYRGYEVSTVKSNNKELEFIQEGDYLEVKNPGEEKIHSLVIEYTGNGNKFYSNRQGIMLPAYFAYYPIANKQVIYDKSTYSFINCCDEMKKHFEIQIETESDINIISNLKKKNNVFTGYSQSPSLIGGLIDGYVKNDDEIIYYPLEDNSKNIEDVHTQLEEALENCKNKIGINTEYEIENKKILQLPATVYSTAYNEDLFIFNDHILTSTDIVDDVANNIILSEVKKHTGFLKISLVEFLNKDKGEYFLENYDTSINQKDIDELVGLYKEKDEYVPKAMLKINSIVAYKMKQLGEQYVINKIYVYLTDKNDIRNEIEFLSELK